MALSITLVPNRMKEFLKYFEIRKFHNPNLTLEICNVTILKTKQICTVNKIIHMYVNTYRHICM